ncbi:transposase family protein [Streptomyces anulatus]|uniref:transposase family protein n=1 Tax=Streptomyces anulatus TaxID=1892 RepID=UPI0036335050
MLTKLGPLNLDDTADLRVFLEAVPDPRSKRGRWYSLASILLVCAAAAVSGARTIDELAEWGARADAGLLATLGVRRHLLPWRHAPSRSAIGRVLERLDADALDAAVGTWLAHRHTATTAAAPDGRGVIAVDGKALRGSARLDQPRRHLLSAVTHGRPITLARPRSGQNQRDAALPAPASAARSGRRRDRLRRAALREDQRHLACGSQEGALRGRDQAQPAQRLGQLDALDWHAVAIQHTTSNKGHGRHESRSIKTLAIADNFGGIAFPHAKLALRVHRRRKVTGKKETRETVHAVTSLDAHQAKPAEPASHLRGHWIVEAQHHIRDRTFAEDASTVHAGNAPHVMATLRNLAIGAFKTLGATNIAKTTRAIRDQPERALPILGITCKPDLNGT